MIIPYVAMKFNLFKINSFYYNTFTSSNISINCWATMFWVKICMN